MALALLALPPWNEPTAAEAVDGLATFYANDIMEQVAAYRGYDGPLEPVALMRAGDLGRTVWVRVDGAWHGPMVAVDCARRDHYEARVAEGKVAEFSWSFWRRLGLPMRPYPVTVSFASPFRWPRHRTQPR